MIAKIERPTYNACYYGALRISFTEWIFVAGSILDDDQGGGLVNNRSHLAHQSILIQCLGCADNIVVVSYSLRSTADH